MIDGPILYLRLGEKDLSGPAYDVSAMHTHGKFVGAMTGGVPGAIAGDPDTACRFVGTDSAVVVSAAVLAFAGTRDFSVEAWARPTDLSGMPRLVAGVSGTPYLDGWSLTYGNAGDERPSVERDREGGAEATFAEAGTLGAYVHLVGTYDGANLRLYANGKLASSIPSPLPIPGLSGKPFTVGADANLVDQHFTGDIDEVAVYDHALLPERVKAHFDAATLGAKP
jgi:large repetitive protein